MGQYRGEFLQEISFPLGGIGTGSIGLSGNGRLIDWEIFNRPAKGSINGYSHIAVKAETLDGKRYVKALNGDLCKDYMGPYQKGTFHGYGFGPNTQSMCGFPHFKDCVFTGEFPIAEIRFSDTDFPGAVVLQAFNPFIPLDDRNSSIPAAFFEVCFSNPTDETLIYTASLSIANPFSSSVNETGESNGYRYIKLKNANAKPDEIGYGDLTVATDVQDADLQPYWYRGAWQDGIVTFWNEFSRQERLRQRSYETAGEYDTCSIAGRVEVSPGETKIIRFILSWYIPNNYNYWDPLKDASGKDIIWKNYYATLFADSTACAVYGLQQWDSLYSRTDRFRRTMFDSTLDPCIIDAAASNLAVLKSPTVLRLEDGSFYGWEGVHEQSGSCEGTCQHVWNYAYALCFLFPKLERSIRELEFRYSMYESGQMEFRLRLPLGREKSTFRACVDGQMGSIIKTYREWKISGDDDWLRRQWPYVKKALSYAWSTENPDEWDLNCDGILEGRQHHTLDMELFGPSSWLEGLYLAALKAAEQMARYIGALDDAAFYMRLYESGKAWMEESLFNGRYYIQKIDIHDKRIVDHFDAQQYWNSEEGEIKYQISDGCSIDQLCGQWHASLCGLGDIFQKEHRITALKSMYHNNFKSTMRTFTNPWRIFCVNDESGAIICDFPEGSHKPAIPVPYSEETMHGFEYELACLLICNGMVEEGIRVVRSIRNRYDGKKRNPWNEFECGSNYARSMASFSLIPAFSGFSFDLPHKCIGFQPVVETEHFKCIWSLDSGWGEYEQNKNQIWIRVWEGSLTVAVLRLSFIAAVRDVKIDGMSKPFTFHDGGLTFDAVTCTDTIQITVDTYAHKK